MKFAGCSLTASFTPIYSNILKNTSRLPSTISRRNLTKSKILSAYSQKDPLLADAVMVAGRYFPPLFSVAPMMDCTDNHYRTLARLITKHAWLYTEMLAAETIVYQKDNLDRFLSYSPDQHPIVLQIGGNNLENLAKATELANAYHYDEINFNCGCPSPKVAGHGCFGARLMLDSKFVGEAMSVIAANTDVPVTVKCRIGVDDHDSYNELCDFIYKVSSLSPTRHFIIHSRKALLNGISPAENRSIPPLKYEYFYGLLRDFPDLRFTINGGITCVDERSSQSSVSKGPALMSSAHPSGVVYLPRRVHRRNLAQVCPHKTPQSTRADEEIPSTRRAGRGSAPRTITGQNQRASLDALWPLAAPSGTPFASPRSSLDHFLLLGRRSRPGPRCACALNS
ncbi:tRNA-dihydrouridine synthase A [Morella rubra]|uniref:tRNA-dihydrouridine synthase A n=1 Tax=Morella rubra TaxID=262757 RepID=A0A6A1WM79_9ROSI|nr:tRNA-dihydrouridine synthase A [Morella rubra]